MSLAQETDALDAVLADPEIRHSLAVIVANAPTLAALAAMGTALLQRGPEISDNVNELVRQLRHDAQGDGGPSIGAAVGSLARLAPLAESVASRQETVQLLLDSPILRPEIVQIVGNFGEAALEANSRTSGRTMQVGGLLSINRQLKDPDIQETLAYLLEFAKVFGERQRKGQ